MQISEAIYAGLTADQKNLLIAADWIEDNFSGHPEAVTYCRRLRNLETLRIQTVVDVIAKFGTRRERREICRIKRIVLRYRKSTSRPKLFQISFETLTSLRDRRYLNQRLGNIIPTNRRMGRYWCEHKKTVIANCKKRRVFTNGPNNWWFLKLLRQLLGKSLGYAE